VAEPLIAAPPSGKLRAPDQLLIDLASHRARQRWDSCGGRIVGAATVEVGGACYGRAILPTIPHVLLT
jgi:hypothetical protein